MRLKFWKKTSSAEEQLDRLRLLMYEEAIKLEWVRCKRKRIYEV
jgi:hypothetical protein